MKHHGEGMGVGRRWRLGDWAIGRLGDWAIGRLGDWAIWDLGFGVYALFGLMEEEAFIEHRGIEALKH